MSKKRLLPLLAIAVLPVLLMFGVQGDGRADRIGKQFAAENPGATIGTHTLEEHLTEEQEINRAQLIIEGIVQKARPYWKIVEEDSFPRIYTEYTIKVADVVKGDSSLNGRTVRVVTVGGTLDGITAAVEAVGLTEGAGTIMLLAKEPHTTYGDAYFPISVSKSIYKIEDGRAINKMDGRTGDRDEVKERISDKLQ